MNLGEIIRSAKTEDTAKTASVASAPASSPAPTTAPSQELLKQALAEALSSAGEKQAAAPAPVGHTPTEQLEKVAAELAQAEEEALLKQARLVGAAQCDGFMERLAMYDNAAARLAGATPTVSAMKTAEADTFEKFAAENPQLTREAAELGFAQTASQLGALEKRAYDIGFERAVLGIYKNASDSYVRGFRASGDVVDAVRRQGAAR